MTEAEVKRMSAEELANLSNLIDMEIAVRSGKKELKQSEISQTARRVSMFATTISPIERLPQVMTLATLVSLDATFKLLDFVLEQDGAEIETPQGVLHSKDVIVATTISMVFSVTNTLLDKYGTDEVLAELSKDGFNIVKVEGKGFHVQGGFSVRG